MKQTIKSIFAMLLVVCMVFTIAGCGETNTESTPTVDEGFFNPTVTDSESKQEGTSSDGADNNVDTSSKDDTTNNTSSDKKDDKDDKDDKDNQGSVNIDIPTENVVGGKPWKEVLASMPKKLRGTSITVCNWNKLTEYTGAPAVVEQFTKQPGIKVTWKVIEYDNYFTKIPAIIRSGKDIPDVVRAKGPIPEYMLSYWPLYKSKFDFTDEAWDQSIMNLYTVNDIPYATSIKNTHIGAVDVMFYNKALIKEYELEDPYELWKGGKWNWDKYIEMCREYKNRTGNPGSSGEGWYWSYLSAFDIDSAIAFDGKKYYNNMTSKEFLTVHQTLCKLYNEEKLLAFGQESFFNEGTRLFSIGSSIHMRRKNSYFGSLKSSNDLYAVPMPAPKSVKKYNQGLNEAEAYAITKGAKNPEAVPYFLRYFLDGANYELSTYFCNKQNLEVYNWCMSHENRNYVYVYPDDIKALDSTGIMGQTGDQVKSFIDANKGTIDKIVKDYNEKIQKLEK